MCEGPLFGVPVLDNSGSGNAGTSHSHPCYFTGNYFIRNCPGKNVWKLQLVQDALFCVLTGMIWSSIWSHNCVRCIGCQFVLDLQFKVWVKVKVEFNYLWQGLCQQNLLSQGGPAQESLFSRKYYRRKPEGSIFNRRHLLIEFPPFGCSTGMFTSHTLEILKNIWAVKKGVHKPFCQC